MHHSPLLVSSPTTMNSDLVLSATASMHGSDSTSSLASLEDRNNSREEVQGDTDVIEVNHDSDATASHHAQAHTINIPHDDDSDDEAEEAAVEAELEEEEKYSTQDLQHIALARIQAGVATYPDANIELVQITAELSHRKRSSVNASQHSRCHRSLPIRLLDSDHQSVLGLIPADADDIFSLETFSTLHIQRMHAQKQLIIAQVTTRDPKDAKSYTACSYSYYDALPLLRTLFKKEGLDVQHRYHKYQPIQPLNPLTNTMITGEVKFFMMNKQSLPDTTAATTSSTTTADLPALSANFVGTDYTFAVSAPFRSLFLQECVEKDRLLQHIHKLLQRPARPSFVDRTGYNGPAAQHLSRLMDIVYAEDRNRHRIAVPIVFPRAVIFGMVLSMYLLVSFLIFENCMEQLANNESGPIILNIASQWYYLTLPPLAFLTDSIISVLYMCREAYLVYLIKAACYALYYLTPYYLFNDPNSHLVNDVIRRSMQMTWPVLFIGYTLGLYLWRGRIMRLE